MKKNLIILTLYALTTCFLACNPNDPSLNDGGNGSSNQDITYKDGVIDVSIKVSPSKNVKFSQGNLQYHAADNTWRFAGSQWETSTENSHAGQYFDGWIDKYMWACNGYDNTDKDPYNTVFQPWETTPRINTTQDYNYFTELNFDAWETNYSGKFTCDYYLVYNYYGIGPTLYDVPFYSRNKGKEHGEMWLITNSATDYNFERVHDWGTNTISNGGSKKWRTLTKSEWEYMLEHNIYSEVTLHGVRGYLIAPETWQKPESLSFTKYNTDSGLNIYSEEESKILLKSGIVFFPKGTYWTATTCNYIETISWSYTSTVSSYWHWYEKYLCTFSSYAYMAGISIDMAKRSQRNFVRLVCED